MAKTKKIGNAKGLLMLLVLVIGLAVGVVGLKSSKLLGGKAVGTKPTCTGSWTCTKGASSYTYPCVNYTGGTELLCTGGGNGQGNYCGSGYSRTNGCVYSIGTDATPTPTSMPTSSPKPSSTPKITPTPQAFKCSQNSTGCDGKSPGSSCYLYSYVNRGSCVASPESEDRYLCYCSSRCNNDSGCTSDFFCQGGSCVKRYPTRPGIHDCDRDRQCQSGHCSAFCSIKLTTKICCNN